MHTALNRLKWLFATILAGACTTALAQGLSYDGLSCDIPEYHCPGSDCSGEITGQRGNQTDRATGRNYFLDIPCDLQRGEEVTFVLNLHGGGSIGNWQRHYFPIMDFKDQYRLIVATPSGVIRAWREDNDDEHLENIVNYVYDRFSDLNIKAFWLAGHSQGGATSHRLVCTDFYADKVDGLLSLAGGRIGFGNRAEAPECDFSHVFTTGEHDTVGAQGVPETSPVAERFNCDARVRHEDVVDTTAGYIYDGRVGDARPDREGWGGMPAPGTAEVYEFPNCDVGRVVADVVRLDKGHTEGLEPNVTERLVQLMLSAGD
ncbi:MAG: alpha/beta hydrolase [Pseudohongiellaceae bacterium]